MSHSPCLEACGDEPHEMRPANNPGWNGIGARRTLPFFDNVRKLRTPFVLTMNG